MSVRPFRTRGAGLITWSTHPDSRELTNTGQQAPSALGWVGTPEPWTALTTSHARFVPSKDLDIIYLEFHVVDAAGSDDQCCVGILDMFGDVLLTSGLVSGLLDTVGTQYWAPSTPYKLFGGTPYYASFGYGAIGTSPATLLCACFPDAPDLEGYGGGNPRQFGYQNTAIYTTVDGALHGPSAAVGAIAPYENWGEAVAMYVRSA